MKIDEEICPMPKKIDAAVMLHNPAWFNHFIFGDPKPDLTALTLPEK
jgi:hypothetical protein